MWFPVQEYLHSFHPFFLFAPSLAWPYQWHSRIPIKLAMPASRSCPDHRPPQWYASVSCKRPQRTCACPPIRSSLTQAPSKGSSMSSCTKSNVGVGVCDVGFDSDCCLWRWNLLQLWLRPLDYYLCWPLPALLVSCGCRELCACLLVRGVSCCCCC